MALHDLNRSNDTPIATLRLSDIAPKNWRRFPPRTATMAPANAEHAKPRYSTMADWAGGTFGDDVDKATAAASIANSSGGANEADYAPRTQAARATQLGTTISVDVARARGWIEPRQPYGPVPAAPVVASLSPDTAVAGSDRLIVNVIGTGFTNWSKVFVGGMTTPEYILTYVSPTRLQIVMNPTISVPGTVSVAVEDHDVLSNTDVVFTFT